MSGENVTFLLRQKARICQTKFVFKYNRSNLKLEGCAQAYYMEKNILGYKKTLCHEKKMCFFTKMVLFGIEKLKAFIRIGHWVINLHCPQFILESNVHHSASYVFFLLNSISFDQSLFHYILSKVLPLNSKQV